ncbi:hypothetical protein G7Z17_g4123 [Cylindrodendrum hubeiense]|uniref:Enoyl reductase (ER) domain-containing protein n=1 Tax=Cylindrodendrum hubeiense TaxID=595255 RepID=A0A9P5HEI7_9HYPO|nr:hypothetical protein G7Z17_g4123 [Cylindrodendrum hubeiense]
MAEHVAALLPAVRSDLALDNRQSPSPGPGEILIRNHVIAVNPIDWKRQASGFMISSYPVVLGADVCGVVAEAGSSVTAFKSGDRVLAVAHSFCSGNNDHGAFQEYTVVKATATVALPREMSFQQGATLPTAAGTATMALFDVLDLPQVTTGETIHASQVGGTANSSESSPLGILVWGGASTVGFLTIQLARLAGLTIYAAASEHHHDHLRSVGASMLVDYHSPTAVDDLLAGAERAGSQIALAVDAISTAETLASVVQVLSKSTAVTKKLAHTSPWPKSVPHPEGIETGAIRGDDFSHRREDLSIWLCNLSLPKWLAEGVIIPPAYRVIDGGLGGLQNALNELKKGVSGEKLLVEV